MSGYVAKPTITKPSYLTSLVYVPACQPAVLGCTEMMRKAESPKEMHACKTQANQVDAIPPFAGAGGRKSNNRLLEAESKIRFAFDV